VLSSSTRAIHARLVIEQNLCQVELQMNLHSRAFKPKQTKTGLQG